MSTNHAPTDFDVHELIKKRWSPRAFSDKPVAPKLLRQLFEAARWAPSSYNAQPWRFIVATHDNEAAYERMKKIMWDFNQGWAANAPVLLVAIKQDDFEQDPRPNPHAGHDVGQALAFMSLEATQHDLYVHQMAGFEPSTATEVLDIPDGYTPITMAAIGYGGDVSTLDEELQKRENAPRSRKSLDEIVWKGTWTDKQAL